MYHHSLKEKKVLSQLFQNRIYLKIHKKYFVKQTAKDFRYYPSKKITKEMGPCTKINYKVSTSVLQNLYIRPGETFNLNQAISRIPGYCKAINGYQNLPFYG
ncbi:MAG: hypothetical protein GXP45_04225 [bacterium]|nr:hypothetical protein [bacterium]